MGQQTTSALTAGLVSGLAATLAADLTAIPDWSLRPEVNRVINLVGGIMLGLTLGRSDWHGEGQGSTQKLVKRRHKDRLFGLLFGLILGLEPGVAAVRSCGLRPVSGIAVGIAVGAAGLLMLGVMPRLAGGFVARLADGEPSPQGPCETWRNDRVFGLRVGLGAGLGFGLWGGFQCGLAAGLFDFFSLMFLVGLAYGITSSVTWSTTLAWGQLRRTHRIPTLALMPFLEHARHRGILRTVGAVYQFRHATLQDNLAGHPTTSPPTYATTKIGA